MLEAIAGRDSPTAAGPLAGRFASEGCRARPHASGDTRHSACLWASIPRAENRTVCQLHRPGRGVRDLIEPDGSDEMRIRPLCSDPCGGEQITGCSRPCEGDRSRAASGQSCSRTLTGRSRSSRLAGEGCFRTELLSDSCPRAPRASRLRPRTDQRRPMTRAAKERLPWSHHGQVGTTLKAIGPWSDGGPSEGFSGCLSGLQHDRTLGASEC